MKEITIDTEKGSAKLMVFVLPITIVNAIPYIIIWNSNLLAGISNILIDNVFMVFLFLIAGTVAHELIHGIIWSFCVKKGIKSIRFGIRWSSFTPYCHCKEPMKLRHYRLGGVMPALLLGFIPSVIAIISGNFAFFAFGLVFSIAAVGDLLIIWMLRKEKSNNQVQDHPDKLGCLIYDGSEQLKINKEQEQV